MLLLITIMLALLAATTAQHQQVDQMLSVKQLLEVIDSDWCKNTEDFGGIDEGCDKEDNICVDAKGMNSIGHDAEGSECVPCVNSSPDPKSPIPDYGCTDESPRCVIYSKHRLTKRKFQRGGKFIDPQEQYAGDTCIEVERPKCKNDAAYGQKDSGCGVSIRRASRFPGRTTGNLCVSKKGKEIGFHVGGSRCAVCRNTQQSDSVADEGCPRDRPRCVMKSRRRRRTLRYCLQKAKKEFLDLPELARQMSLKCLVIFEAAEAPLGEAGENCVPDFRVCKNSATFGNVDKGCSDIAPICIGDDFNEIASGVEGEWCAPCLNTMPYDSYGGDYGCANYERCVNLLGESPEPWQGGLFCVPLKPS